MFSYEKKFRPKPHYDIFVGAFCTSECGAGSSSGRVDELKNHTMGATHPDDEPHLASELIVNTSTLLRWMRRDTFNRWFEVWLLSKYGLSCLLFTSELCCALHGMAKYLYWFFLFVYVNLGHIFIVFPILLCHSWPHSYFWFCYGSWMIVFMDWNLRKIWV